MGYDNDLQLSDAFGYALDAAEPARWLAPALAKAGIDGPVRVLALGKSAVAMAEAFVALGGRPTAGLAVTVAGTGRAVDGFEILESAHPVPDERSLRAGEAVLAFAAATAADETLLVLVSGGTSALVCAPIAGVSLEEKAALTRSLLASGAAIGDINRVRRALSRVKGGGLLRATGRARVVTIAQSDVPGDRLDQIGSGPSVEAVADPEAAIALLHRCAPAQETALAGPIREQARRASPIQARWTAMVGFGIEDGARAAARFLGDARNLGVFETDAAVAASAHREAIEAGGAGVYVSCGELSVAVPALATGRGGRNQHFLLNLAVELAGRSDVWALAADTDGVDGSSDAAGATLDPDLLATLDVGEARAALANFDAHGFFARHGRLIETGPTGVNVGDLRMVLVG